MRYFIILILITFIIAILNAEEKQYVSDIIFKGNSTFSDDELSYIVLLKSPTIFIVLGRHEDTRSSKMILVSFS